VKIFKIQRGEEGGGGRNSESKPGIDLHGIEWDGMRWARKFGRNSASHFGVVLMGFSTGGKLAFTVCLLCRWRLPAWRRQLRRAGPQAGEGPSGEYCVARSYHFTCLRGRKRALLSANPPPSPPHLPPFSSIAISP